MRMNYSSLLAAERRITITIYNVEAIVLVTRMNSNSCGVDLHSISP